MQMIVPQWAAIHMVTRLTALYESAKI